MVHITIADSHASSECRDDGRSTAAAGWCMWGAGGALQPGGAPGRRHRRSVRHADQGQHHLRRALRVLGPPAAGLRARAALRPNRALVLQRLHHQVVRDSSAHGMARGLLPKERARGMHIHTSTYRHILNK